jgi:hypothetical protein
MVGLDMFIKVRQIGANEEFWNEDEFVWARYNVLNIRSYSSYDAAEETTSMMIQRPQNSVEIIVDHTVEEVDLMIEKANEKSLKILFGKNHE